MKKIISLFLALLLTVLFIIPASADGEETAVLTVGATESATESTTESGVQDGYYYAIDSAYLLTDEELDLLENKLGEISARHNSDILVVTVDSLDGYTDKEFADGFYDYYEYAADGMLLLISIEDRIWYISTAGKCKDAVTDYGIEYFGNRMYDDLHSGNYYAAFNVYANLCDEFLTQAETGEPYDKSSLPAEPLEGKWYLISLAIGVVFALIVVGIMKGKLKSVHFESAAANYIKNNSLKITGANEIFLYKNVTRTAKPEKSSGGSGSSGSSSHGGGGGRF